jgi:hypothetical protein
MTCDLAEAISAALCASVAPPRVKAPRGWRVDVERDPATLTAIGARVTAREPGVRVTTYLTGHLTPMEVRHRWASVCRDAADIERRRCEARIESIRQMCPVWPEPNL